MALVQVRKDDIDGSDGAEEFRFGWGVDSDPVTDETGEVTEEGSEHIEYTIDVTEDKVMALLDVIEAQRKDQVEVSYTIDGERHTFWTSKTRAEKLEAAFSQFVEHATEYEEPAPTLPIPAPAVAAGKKKSDPNRLARIRAWANRRGMGVSEKGRIAGHIVDAYDREHPNDPA